MDILHVLTHSLLETLKLCPFLLVIYVLIELLENKTTFTKNHNMMQGRLSPLIGTATGIIPQCGFSVMAAKLYDRGFIKTGTLMAVFLATSDEALIILLSGGTNGAMVVAPLIAVKFIVAIFVGYLVNALMNRECLAPVVEHKPHEEEFEHCHEHGEDIHAYSCGREHEGKKPIMVYFVAPLLHALKIALFLFIVNFVFGLFVEWVGEENIQNFMNNALWAQPFITSLIGLIPNCASSVLITGVYLNGGIAFGSMVAGLCTNAGLGFVVLLKNTKKIKRNLYLLGSMYVISVIVGLSVNAVMLACNLL